MPRIKSAKKALRKSKSAAERNRAQRSELRHLGAAVDFLADHHAALPFARLIDGPYPLDAAEDAFRHAARARSLRVAVVP